MNEFFFTKSDNLPKIEVIVSGDGAAVDLSSSTGVIFLSKPRYSGSSTVISGGFTSKVSGIVFVNLTGSTITANLGPQWGKFLLYYENGGLRSYPQTFINFEVLSGII